MSYTYGNKKKTVDTLIPDIYGIFNNPEFKATPEFVELLLQQIKNTVIPAVEEAGKPSGEPYLRMSSIGKPDRQLWYEFNRPDLAPSKKFKPQDHIKFCLGHLIEAFVMYLIRESGHTVSQAQKEVFLEGVKGHLDLFVDGVLTDVKSTSPFAFNKFLKGNCLAPENDSFGYAYQISGYMEAEGQREGMFFPVQKVTGELYNFFVYKEDLPKASERIKHLRKILSDKDNIPDRCYSDEPYGESGNRILSKECTYCPFKVECWKDSNHGEGLRVYDYSDGRKYFTKVVKEPRVSAIRP